MITNENLLEAITLALSAAVRQRVVSGGYKVGVRERIARDWAFACLDVQRRKGPGAFSGVSSDDTFVAWYTLVSSWPRAVASSGVLS